MRKIIATITLMAVMMVAIPLVSQAQTYRQTRRIYNRSYSSGYYQNNRPNFYRRHRDLVNVGVGTGAGLIVGGLIGGRRGAGIGALLGAGGSALYTYKINPKRPRYYRRY